MSFFVILIFGLILISQIQQPLQSENIRNLKVLMDYEALQCIIPKKSQMWSMEDISKWLAFIQLPALIQVFAQTSIDGSCVHLLDEEILKEELHISSPIIRKKILNWTSFGLAGFNQYITSLEMIKMDAPLPNLKKSETTNLRKQAKSKLANHCEVMEAEESSSTENYLILEQYQGNSLGFNIIRNEIMSIGYGKFNHIHSLETSISERHALIGRSKQSGAYFVQDLGSKHGTYIKINQRTPLHNGMILEIGSYQFMVADININNQTLRLKQVNVLEPEMLSENNKNLANLMDDGKNKKGLPIMENLLVDLKSSSKFSFGRRKDNNFQRDDKHMSGMHCKITFFSNTFYVQDYGSTNGTWLRISPAFTTSIEVPIQNGMFIKVGAAITYICRIKSGEKTQSRMIDENSCRVCGNEENNCLFVPCGHNVCCIQCSSQIGDTCGECGHFISEKIKIHK